jgi:hypothetical protein
MPISTIRNWARATDGPKAGEMTDTERRHEIGTKRDSMRKPVMVRSALSAEHYATDTDGSRKIRTIQDPVRAAVIA